MPPKIRLKVYKTTAAWGSKNKIECRVTILAGVQSRSFDINITTIHDIKYTFSSIEKDEYGRLHDYLKGKKCKVR